MVLSGTPMENSLKELWSLLNFVERGLLGELKTFEKDYCQQIIKGGYITADEAEKETAKKLIGELRYRIRGHILRRTRRQLGDDCKLPQRNELIVPCRMTQAQLTVYEAYLDDVLKHIDVHKLYGVNSGS